jgi:peptidyl-prolyl cis-trans isomerase SurA
MAPRRSSVWQNMWTSMTGFSSARRPPLLARGYVIAAVAAVAIIGSLSPASAQQVLAVVNGVPITSYDVDQRTRLIQISAHKTPSRKEVLEELIDEKVKLIEAKKFGLEATGAEVERSFASMASRMGMDPPQLTKALSSRGIDANTLKARIRADLVWGNLVRGRYQASLQVGEGDIQALLGRPSADDKGAIGHVYRLRPILFIVPQGSPASAFDARRREAEALRSRFDNCEQGVALARELRDVAVRDAITRNSSSLPEEMRKRLNSVEIGKLTTPEQTAQGIEAFAVCGREVTRADTPRKQEARQEIFQKRYEAQSKRYLQQIRRSAMIEYK